MEKGFYKVGQSGSCYVSATFYNPETKETKTCCVRDYDYADCSRDDDDLYYMEINEEVRKQFMHDNGYILIGDTVKVVKGRKVPIGTVAKVTDERIYKDRYGRIRTLYVYLDNGMKTNINNCELMNE